MCPGKQTIICFLLTQVIFCKIEYKNKANIHSVLIFSIIIQRLWLRTNYSLYSSLYILKVQYCEEVFKVVPGSNSPSIYFKIHTEFKKALLNQTNLYIEETKYKAPFLFSRRKRTERSLFDWKKVPASDSVLTHHTSFIWYLRPHRHWYVGGRVLASWQWAKVWLTTSVVSFVWVRQTIHTFFHLKGHHQAKTPYSLCHVPFSLEKAKPPGVQIHPLVLVDTFSSSNKAILNKPYSITNTVYT